MQWDLNNGNAPSGAVPLNSKQSIRLRQYPSRETAQLGIYYFLSMSTPTSSQAEQNLRNAIIILGKAIPKEAHTLLDQVKLPAVEDHVSAETYAVEIQGVIDRLIEAMAKKNEGLTTSEKAKQTAKKWFAASFPFATVVLSVAQSASAVKYPFFVGS